uniref:Uncharacterized protein n=1 Tax=Solanum tuberosum TaxID=4113 RepID=M1A1Z4_SOLTU
MSNSHSSLDYHQYLQFMSVYRLGVRMTSRQYTFTPRNYQLVEQDVQDNLNDQSPPNSPDDSQVATELIDDQQEDAILFRVF